MGKIALKVSLTFFHNAPGLTGGKQGEKVASELPLEYSFTDLRRMDG